MPGWVYLWDNESYPLARRAFNAGCPDGISNRILVIQLVCLQDVLGKVKGQKDNFCRIYSVCVFVYKT